MQNKHGRCGIGPKNTTIRRLTEIKSPNARPTANRPGGFAGSQNRRSPGLVVSIEEAMPKRKRKTRRAGRSEPFRTDLQRPYASRVAASKAATLLENGRNLPGRPVRKFGEYRRPAPQPSDQTRPENPMNAIARIPAVISAMGMPLNALGTSSKSRRSRMPAKSTSASAKPRAVATE